jgi:hypothetical protein
MTGGDQGILITDSKFVSDSKREPWLNMCSISLALSVEESEEINVSHVCPPHRVTYVWKIEYMVHLEKNVITTQTIP